MDIYQAACNIFGEGAIFFFGLFKKITVGSIYNVSSISVVQQSDPVLPIIFKMNLMSYIVFEVSPQFAKTC